MWSPVQWILTQCLKLGCQTLVLPFLCFFISYPTLESYSCRFFPPQITMFNWFRSYTFYSFRGDLGIFSSPVHPLVVVFCGLVGNEFSGCVCVCEFICFWKYPSSIPIFEGYNSHSSVIFSQASEDNLLLLRSELLVRPLLLCGNLPFPLRFRSLSGDLQFSYGVSRCGLLYPA